MSLVAVMLKWVLMAVVLMFGLGLVGLLVSVIQRKLGLYKPGTLKYMCNSLQHMTRVIKLLEGNKVLAGRMVVAGSNASQLSFRSGIRMLRILSQETDTAVRFMDYVYKPSKSAEQDSIRRTDSKVLIVNFAALLTILMPQLARQGSQLSLNPARKGSAADHLFPELWCGLKSSSRVIVAASERYPDTWLMHISEPQTSLYTAYQALLTWLASFLRSPAWKIMTQQQGLDSCKHDLLFILHAPVLGLQCLSLASKDNLISHAQLLPQTLLSMLCCIISEQFLSNPQPAQGHVADVSAQSASLTTACIQYDTATSSLALRGQLIKLLDTLVLTLTYVKAANISASHPALWALLKDPAVSRLLKLVVILPEASRQPQLLQNSLACLTYISQNSHDSTSAGESAQTTQ